MKTPKPLRKLEQQGVAVREYDDDDKSVIAVDFGGGSDDLTIDIVDDTVIVVVDDQQFEFELPPGANDVTTKGGILTIKG